MSAHSPHEEEDDYVSSEDDDFDPTAADQDGNVSSDSGDDDEQPLEAVKGRKPATKKAKPKKTEEAEDAGFENSGDEGIIRKATKKRRKNPEEDSGGEGGFVKTRSMRAVA